MSESDPQTNSGIRPEIRKRLALDHFYIPATAAEIQELMPLTTLLNPCTHRRVASGNEHWEGIYLHSRTGVYWEIVDYHNSSNFGIAMSPAQPQYTDARKIKEEFPTLRWVEKRHLSKKHTPWFDSLTTSKDTPDCAVPFYAWVMHYHFSHWDDRPVLTGVRAIERFKSVHLSMGSHLVAELKDSIAWMPGEHEFSSNRIHLKIPDREGSSFVIEIDIRGHADPLMFHRLEAQISRGIKIKSKNVGIFALRKASNDILVFEKR